MTTGALSTLVPSAVSVQAVEAAVESFLVARQLPSQATSQGAYALAPERGGA
jgi:hypothetical protein